MINPSFDDFESAGRAVLAYLHQRFGFKLWMLTRTEGDDWIVLQSEDHGYGITPGKVFRWSDSLCTTMVNDNGPRVAPNSDLIASYAAAPIGKQVAIKAYVGVPLTRDDGSLFGTLCAIDPSQQSEAIVQEQNLIEMLAGLLSVILRKELKATDDARRCELLTVESHTDALTKLLNRRAWDQLLENEEKRCSRYGHSAAVLTMDLDELKQINDSLGHPAGDALLQRAALALRLAARETDVIARLGGDEFGIIAAECDRVGVDALVGRVRAALASANVKASLGFALRAPSSGLCAAWQLADQRMYAEKRTRQVSLKLS